MSDYDFEIEDEEEVEPLHTYAPGDEYAFDLGEEEDDSSAGVDVPAPPPPRFVRPNATHVLQRETCVGARMSPASGLLPGVLTPPFPLSQDARAR